MLFSILALGTLELELKKGHRQEPRVDQVKGPEMERQCDNARWVNEAPRTIGKIMRTIVDTATINNGGHDKDGGDP